jgi:hypothetical protein
MQGVGGKQVFNLIPKKDLSMLIQNLPLDQIKPYEQNPRLNDSAVDNAWG